MGYLAAVVCGEWTVAASVPEQHSVREVSEPFDVPENQYKFHSEGIIETLQRFLSQFTEHINNSDQVWNITHGEHEVTPQGQADEKAALLADLAREEDGRTDTLARMSTLNEQMSDGRRPINQPGVVHETQAECLEKQKTCAFSIVETMLIVVGSSPDASCRASCTSTQETCNLVLQSVATLSSSGKLSYRKRKEGHNSLRLCVCSTSAILLCVWSRVPS